MRKIFHLLFFSFLCFNLLAQKNSSKEDKSVNENLYKSSNGISFPTQGIFRTLTIFVNIIYDQTPENDPYPNPESTIWKSSTSDEINTNPPAYMLNLFDTEIQPDGEYNGAVTRLFAESSFNQLIFISDFIIVNIKQSEIRPNKAGASFNKTDLMKAVIAYINRNGFRTYFGHNNLSDYDILTPGVKGKPKPLKSDSNIDLINFLIRNPTRTYGGYSRGEGNTGSSATMGISSTKLIVGDTSYGFNQVTCQGVGEGDITREKKNVLVHEFAHLFLGGNEFHTSGGVTTNDNYHNTFIGSQFGYGFFNGGLLSCNAFERWRLGWRGPDNQDYPIASNHVNSDVSQQFKKEQTFLLRDFVTYGDAIRIKLPYKDSEKSSWQYIWLENHQYSKNNKIDGFIYSQPNTCRNAENCGIFAYHQVGKDVLESTSSPEVFPTNEKDNLRMISAEGNYNIVYEDLIRDCLGWGERPKFRYISPNPLQGNNNQTEAYSYDTTASLLVYPANHKFIGAKIKGDSLYNDMPWLGSDVDAFIPQNELVMDISTNPAPVNVVTYYSTRNNGVMKIRPEKRNTRKIYLTGLSIKMIDPKPDYNGMKSYIVKIRWDDYDVKQNVNWAGDIVLKEKLNLLEGKTITLEQNWTPNQMEKDSVSNFFAPATRFTCENGSKIKMEKNSSFVVKDKSVFTLESGSELTIQNNAQLIVKAGSTLLIKDGAKLNIQKNGKITIEENAYICIDPDASVNLKNRTSMIELKKNAIQGVNNKLISNSNCSINTATKGKGKISVETK